MFARLLQRFSDSQLRREVEQLQAAAADLRQRLTEEQSRNKILELEQEKLLAVMERDRQRVAAETKRFAAEIASNELPPAARR